MAVLYFPSAGQSYLAYGTTYTTDAAGMMTVTDPLHEAELRRQGLMDPPPAPTLPPSGGSGSSSGRVTFDMT